jgi:hypothetical protein
MTALETILGVLLLWMIIWVFVQAFNNHEKKNK